MNATALAMDNLTLNITQEIHVRASLEVTFASLLEELGPHNEADGKPMPMKIEPWPGGRWYRDLGDNNGHFWGHVQAIKRPALLECPPKDLSRQPKALAWHLAHFPVKGRVEAERNGQADEALGTGDAGLDLVTVFQDHER